MKKLLFIALIISQVLISVEGILFTERESFGAIEKKELSQEDQDELGLPVRTRAHRLMMPVLSMVATPAITKFLKTNANDVFKNQQGTPPFFIRHRCLRV